MIPPPVPLQQPALPSSTVSPDQSSQGLPIPAIDRLRLFSHEEWEDFVQEWAHSLKNEYVQVERCGGAGDLGRDVIAYVSPGAQGEWDNYQCKHYGQPLQPSDIWCELGKLCYYTFIKAYSIPRYYYFVAPHGVGNKLSRKIKQPDELRKDLIDNWDTYCREAITKQFPVELTGLFRSYVEAFDFGIIKAITPLTLIEQHRETQWHVARFGGGLPPRPIPQAPPAAIAVEEARYVRALFDAYGDYLKVQVPDVAALQPHSVLKAHFVRAREEFYSAESLRAFSRDTLPQGQFEVLQEELYTGVVDVAESEYASAYERIVKTVQEARRLQITDHALVPRMRVADRGGICHQLANNERLRWVISKANPK